MDQGQIDQEDYNLQITHKGVICSCSCACNPTNPVDVTVDFQLKEEKQSITITPESVKKLS